MMHELLISTGIVALAEMGDKTQLLALLLSTQFRRPVPVILGMLVATLVNHAFAGAVGAWVAGIISPDILRWVLGGSFLAMAIWTLIPDKLDEDAPQPNQLGVFTATLVAFFLAEMGDKTQLATVALAAEYHSLVWVVAGTSLGMMIANVPVVLLGEWIVQRIPVRKIHVVCALLFAILGLVILLDVAHLSG